MGCACKYYKEDGSVTHYEERILDIILLHVHVYDGLMM